MSKIELSEVTENALAYSGFDVQQYARELADSAVMYYSDVEDILVEARLEEIVKARGTLKDVCFESENDIQKLKDKTAYYISLDRIKIRLKEELEADLEELIEEHKENIKMEENVKVLKVIELTKSAIKEL